MSVEYLVKHKEAILQGIQKLIDIPKEKETDTFDPYFGICYNLSNILSDLKIHIGYDIVCYYDFTVDWPNYSGKPVYPIIRDGFTPRWEGKQLEYRISLLHHLYKKIEELEL